MVLSEYRSCQHMGQMFCGVPRQVLPAGQNECLARKNIEFQADRDGIHPEAWERLQEYIHACPHHGMDEWLILQTFYNGLTTTSRAHLDAAAGGAYLNLTIAKAKDLIEKMVANQG